MRQKVIGVYEIGMDQVQLVIREGYGGEFWLKPGTGVIPRIKVGVDGTGWNEVVTTLLHEAMEMQMTKSHCRFSRDPDYGRDHGGYIFLMDHTQFSDVTARVASFMAEALPDLAIAFNRWKKKRPTDK